MKKDRYEDWFSDLDDRSIEEIAADVPALDDAARDRIEALCEEKMRMRDMKMGNEEIVYAGNIQNITRTQWFRPAMTAAACLVLAAGVGGMMMLGGNHHGITPQPPVNSGIEDTTAASGEETETPTQETITVIATETALSGVTEISGTTAVTTTTATTTETVIETAIEGVPVYEMPELSVLKALCSRNADCLSYFVTSPCPTVGEALDGQFIYEVDFPEFANYAALERYVYGTYADSFANELLHNFPKNGPMYLDYNGKLCIDTYYVLENLYLEGDWSNVEITNPAMISENRLTFDIVVDNYDEPIGCTAIAVLENGSWQLEKMYGYDKVDLGYPEKEDVETVAVKEDLALLVRMEMQLSPDYLLKENPISGTSVYEVDFENMVSPESYFFDYETFSEYLYEVFTPETAEWVLYDSVFENVNGNLCIDTSKTASIQEAPVNWEEFFIEIDSMSDSGNTCTFRAVATDHPDYQLPGTTLEDRTDYYTAQYINGLGWRLSEKPDYLLK